MIKIAFILLSATRGDIGVGFVLGLPTGLSMKYFLQNDKALEINAAIYMSQYGTGLSGIILYEWHDAHVFRERGMEFFYGLGPTVFTYNNPETNTNIFGVGAGGVVGIEYFTLKHLSLFGEVGPFVSILPSTYFSINGGLGLRFYF